MGLFAKLDRHADLMNRMAETLHTDLSGALARESLSAQELRNAIMACVGCEGGSQCPDWLHKHPQGADDAPAYCRNRAVFHRLKEAV